MTNDIQLKFVCRTSGGAVNKLYVKDVSTYSGETVQIKVHIIVDGTLYYQDESYSFPQGGEVAYDVPVYEGRIKNGTYSVIAYFKDVSETYVTKTAVLGYTPPVISPVLVIDGFASNVSGYDGSESAYPHEKLYEHTHPDTSVETFTDTYSISPIKSGTHRLTVYHDITVTNVNYQLLDRVSGYVEAVAYKLGEADVYYQVVDYKRAYRSQTNPNVKRSMLARINELDRYEDDYFMAKRQQDSLTAYNSLRTMYLLMNENPVVNVEVIPVWNPSEDGVTAHNELTPESRALSDQHPISSISSLTETILNIEQAVSKNAGASIVIDKLNWAIPTTETLVPFEVAANSTDTNIIEFDDQTSTLTVKEAGSHFLLSTIRFYKSIPQSRTVTLVVRDADTNQLINSYPSYPRTIDITTGIGYYTPVSAFITVNAGANQRLRFYAYASGTGVSFSEVYVNFYSATGGSVGLWKNNSNVELYIPKDIDARDKSILNTFDTEINSLNSISNGGVIDNSAHSWLSGLVSLTAKSIKSYISGIVKALYDKAPKTGEVVVQSATSSVTLDSTILPHIFPVNSGEMLIMTVQCDSFPVSPNRFSVKINGISTTSYIWSTSLLARIPLAGTNYVKVISLLNLTVYNTSAIGYVQSLFDSGSGYSSSQLYNTGVANILTESRINSLLVYLDAGGNIPAGVVIRIKKC